MVREHLPTLRNGCAAECHALGLACDLLPESGQRFSEKQVDSPMDFTSHRSTAGTGGLPFSQNHSIVREALTLCRARERRQSLPAIREQPASRRRTCPRRSLPLAL